MEKNKIKYKIIFVVAFAIILFFPHYSRAASFLVTPENGSSTVGSVFSASVQISSLDRSMNALSGTLSYPADLLSVVSIDKGSLLTQWLPPGSTGPRYIDGSGFIKFEGVTTEGYQGPATTVFTVNFKVKKVGVANLKLSKLSILENDGNGTEILTSVKNSTIDLGEALPVSATTTTEIQKPAPILEINPIVISSDTVPVWFLGSSITIFSLLLLLIVLLIMRSNHLSNRIAELEFMHKSYYEKPNIIFKRPKPTPKRKPKEAVTIKIKSKK